MTDFVLGKQTQHLVTQIREIDGNFISPRDSSGNELDHALELVIFHGDIFLSKELFTHTRFLIESLRTAILDDLHKYFFKENKQNREDTSVWGRLRLALIAIAGTGYNICNGFDISVSMLNLFIGIPFWTVFAVGLGLSFVFVILFYGVDLVGISENLHIRISESRRLLDLFHQQALFTQALIEKSKQQLDIENNNLLEKMVGPSGEDVDIHDLMYWLKIMERLTTHQSDLQSIRVRYQSELEQYYVYLLKWLMAVLAGILYFNSGFFVGQVFATLLFSAFISTSVSMLSWPVMLISCSVGVAALLSVFWFYDRLDVENLVGRWIGLDIDKIDQLPDDNLIQENQAYLARKKQGLGSLIQINQRLLSVSAASTIKDDESSYQQITNEM